MRNLIQVGTKIFNPRNSSEFRRLVVFTARSFFYRKSLNGLFEFFEESKIKKEIVEDHPWFFEQATRHVFYKGSTIDERCKNNQRAFCVYNRAFLLMKVLKEIYLK